MDFHSLSRKELQALCKKHRIPANMTNVAMADALKALGKIEEIDDLCREKDLPQTLPEEPSDLDRSCRITGSRTSALKRIGEEELKEREYLDDQPGILPESSPTFTRTRRITAGRAASTKRKTSKEEDDVLRKQPEIRSLILPENLVFSLENTGSEIPMTPLDLSFTRSGRARANGTSVARNAEKSECKDKKKQGALTRTTRRRSPLANTTIHNTRRSSRLKVPDNPYEATVSKELFESESVEEPNNRKPEFDEDPGEIPVVEESSESPEGLGGEGEELKTMNLVFTESDVSVSVNEDAIIQKSNEMVVVPGSLQLGTSTGDSGVQIADAGQQKGSQIAPSSILIKGGEIKALLPDEVLGPSSQNPSEIHGDLNSQLPETWNEESEKQIADAEQEQGSQIFASDYLEEGNAKAPTPDKISGEIHSESLELVEDSHQLGPCNAECEEHEENTDQEQRSQIFASDYLEEGNAKAPTPDDLNSQLPETWNANSEKQIADAEQEQGSQIFASDYLEEGNAKPPTPDKISRELVEDSQPLGPCNAECEEHEENTDQEQSSLTLDSGSAIEEGNSNAQFSDKVPLEPSQIAETFSPLGSVNFTNTEQEQMFGIIDGFSQMDIGKCDLKSSVNDETFSQALESCNTEPEINITNPNQDLGSDLGSPKLGRTATSFVQGVGSSRVSDESSRLSDFSNPESKISVEVLASNESLRLSNSGMPESEQSGQDLIQIPCSDISQYAALDCRPYVASGESDGVKEPQFITAEFSFEVPVELQPTSEVVSNFIASDSNVASSESDGVKEPQLITAEFSFEVPVELQPTSEVVSNFIASDSNVASGESDGVKEPQLITAEFSIEVSVELQPTGEVVASDSNNVDSDHGAETANDLPMCMFSGEVSSDYLSNSQKSICSSDVDLNNREVDILNNKENTDQAKGEVDLKKVSFKEVQKLLNKGEIDLNQLSIRKLKRFLKENSAKNAQLNRRAPLQKLTENFLGCEQSK